MNSTIRYLFCFGALLTSVACDLGSDPPPAEFDVEVENGNCIMAYLDGRIQLDSNIGIYGPDETERIITIRIDPNETFYSRWVPPYWQQGEPKHEQYDEIAQRNGDTGFTGRILREMTVALAQNFSEMHLTCDKDWDEVHPAGIPIDDLVKCTFTPYGPYILGGYTDGLAEKTKMLAEVTADEWYIIGSNMYFDITIPQHLMGSHFDLTLRYVDREGKSGKTSCRIKTSWSDSDF